MQVPKKSTWGDKVKSRSAFKKKGVSRGTYTLGIAWGEERQKALCLASVADSSYGHACLEMLNFFGALYPLPTAPSSI